MINVNRRNNSIGEDGIQVEYIDNTCNLICWEKQSPSTVHGPHSKIRNGPCHRLDEEGRRIQTAQAQAHWPSSQGNLVNEMK